MHDYLIDWILYVSVLDMSRHLCIYIVYNTRHTVYYTDTVDIVYQMKMSVYILYMYIYFLSVYVLLGRYSFILNKYLTQTV